MDENLRPTTTNDYVKVILQPDRVLARLHAVNDAVHSVPGMSHKVRNIPLEMKDITHQIFHIEDYFGKEYASVQVRALFGEDGHKYLAVVIPEDKKEETLNRKLYFLHWLLDH